MRSALNEPDIPATDGLRFVSNIQTSRFVYQSGKCRPLRSAGQKSAWQICRFERYCQLTQQNHQRYILQYQQVIVPRPPLEGGPG